MGKRSTTFVSANNLDAGELAKLWDETALTSLEDEITSAIRDVLFPSVERIAFRYLGEGSNSRVPYVKVENSETPLPLRSMGDGVNRFLGIALALANSKGGVLLVDEIENGLHYSVQTDVWRFLLRLAARLNVQIFATTHSSDCVRAFQEAASESEEDGVLFHLGRRGDEIVATEFDEDGLEIAVEMGMELRG